jgi:hypothetical protein
MNTFKTESLTNFADLLKSNGFDVIVDRWSHSTGPLTYFHFHKDGKIGYVQEDRFRGFSFSTVHRPSREVGTGYGIVDMIGEPTIEHAMDAFKFAPHWAKKSDLPHIKKYASLADFLEKKGQSSNSFIY